MKPDRWRWAIRDAQIDTTAKVVAWTLASRMNGRGVCWPSKTRLAQDCGLCVRAVDGAVRRLELLGFVEVTRRPPAPNLYTAHLPRTRRPRNQMRGDPASDDTLTPHLDAGEDKREGDIEEFAHAIQVDPAMLALARGWLATTGVGH